MSTPNLFVSYLHELTRSGPYQSLLGLGRLGNKALNMIEAQLYIIVIGISATIGSNKMTVHVYRCSCIIALDGY